MKIKTSILSLLIFLAIQINAQTNYYSALSKIPHKISLQLIESGADSINVIYNVDFKERERVQLFPDKPLEKRSFKANERFTYKCAKDSLIKINIPPYFLNDTNLVLNEIKHEKYRYEVSFFAPHFLDRHGEKVAYTDSIGNGTLYIIPNNSKKNYELFGSIYLYQRAYSFDEILKNEEVLILGRIPAIAIRLESIKNNKANLLIGHDILRTSKELPSVSGVRIRPFQLTLNDKSPKYIGHDFSGEKIKEKKTLNEMDYYYIPVQMDRAENGSFNIKEISPGKYKLSGIYSYYGKVFKIDHEITIGKEIGVIKHLSLE